MKIPTWFKNSYTEPTSKKLTQFMLIGGPVLQLATLVADRIMYGSYQWDWDALLFMYGFYLLIYLPASYLMRNSK